MDFSLVKTISPFFEIQYFGNSLAHCLLAVFIAFSILVITVFGRRLMLRHLKVSQGGRSFHQGFALLFNQTKFLFLLLLSLGGGALLLNLPPLVKNYFAGIFILGILFQLALWGNVFINFYLQRYRELHLLHNAAGVTTISSLGFLLKLLFFSFLLLLAFNNLGINISALLAGLGIGGVAVALAAQNILGDLFASLSIVLDKPFVIGDFIIVEGYEGKVENIGLKTTRIRSISGEEIIFSNADLLKSRIRNYRRMTERRILFSIAVSYQTSYEALKKVPAKMKEIIELQPQSRFDRAHLKSLGETHLIFEVAYFLLQPEFKFFMEVQQDIYFKILKSFEDLGIVLSGSKT